MRRVFVILATTLSLIAAACGSDSITSTSSSPTPEPAATVAGESVPVETSEVEAQAMVVGIPLTQVAEIRALPGFDQPIAGDPPAGTNVELMGQAFETEDGTVWWQVRADAVQGWMPAQIAYRGPTQDITDPVLVALGSAVFTTSEAAATAVAEHVASGQGTSEIVMVSKTEIPGTGSATITIDLLGFQDDSIQGFRLIIAATAANNWRPASVLQAQLCARGVNADGRCA